MKKRDAFSSINPFAELIFFVYVPVITMLVMHPAVICISLVSAAVYSFYLTGKKALKLQLFGVLPVILLTALINPLFNHAGQTTLFYLPNGNPVTLEAVLYGLAAAGMFASVIVWFSCFNKVMTSDKLIYLFGKIIPALSLLFSMVLRFVPRFTNKIKETANAQVCIGRDPKSGNIIKRALCGMRILSITVTWALESAVNTADSMKSRGYGHGRRTAYSTYRLDMRDTLTLAAMIITGALFIITFFTGSTYIRYYPSVRMNAVNAFSVLGFCAFFLFCNLPMIINITEDIRWQASQSRI